MATAVIRQGDRIDQYIISDPGNISGFDGNILTFSFQATEVVIQSSATDFSTRPESLLCWNDPDIVECPNDIMPDGSYRMPALVFLDAIQLAGDVTVGADLTLQEELLLQLAFWHEYRTKDAVVVALDLMEQEGLNNLQKKRALKYVYVGNEIDPATAKILADDKIDSLFDPDYSDLDKEELPVHDKQLLNVAGASDWV